MYDTYLRAAGWTVLLGCVACLLARCDVPTEGMDVSGSATVSVPLFAEQTYAFLGNGKENEVLIDTTTGAFDRLFTTSGGDQQLFIEHETGELDAEGLGDMLDEATRFLKVDERLSASLAELDDFTELRFEGAHREDSEVVETEPAELESAALLPANDAVRIPFPLDAALGAPSYGPVSAEGVTIRSATLTEETTHSGQTVNAFEFTLRSQAGETLTDGSGNPPRVALVRADGSIIAEEAFGTTVPPGGSARAEMILAGETLEADMELRFALSDHAELETRVTPLRYQRAVAHVEDLTVAATGHDIALEGPVDFAGIEVDEGTARISIENAFDAPLQVDALVVRNRLDDVPELPDGFGEVAFRTEDHVIDRKSTTEIPLDLAGAEVAERVDISLRASLYGPPTDVRMSADDFVRIGVGGDASIQRLHVRPAGETFERTYTFGVEAEKARFESDDFIEVEDGTLHVEDLAVEPDLAFEEFALTSPTIRRPPYAIDDRLAIRFEGATEDPAQYRFPEIGRDDPPRSVSIPLDGLRFYPVENTAEVALRGRAESSKEVRTLRASDELSGRLRAEGLALRAVAVHMEPVSVPLSRDADGDGRLDVMDEREARRTSLGLLDGIHVDGLELDGSRLSLHVTTNISADVTLYGALLGTSADGTTTYLSGRGPLAVAPTDSLAGRFTRDGTSIPAGDLIRLEVKGAPPGETVTRTIVLDASNSTVDAFISEAPDEVRLVGTAIVPSAEQRVRLRRPLALTLGLGLSTPLQLRSDFTVRDTLDADLSDLPDFTDPERRAQLTGAELEVAYENGIPLGADVELVFLDAAGRPTVRVDNPMRLEPAPKAENGTAGGFRDGTLSADLEEDDLRPLTESERLALIITFRPGEGPASRVRATDSMRLAIRGSFEGAF